MKVKFFHGKYTETGWKIGAPVKVNSHLFKSMLRPNKQGTMTEYAGKISTPAKLAAGSHLVLDRDGLLSAVSVEPSAEGLSGINQYLIQEVAVI